MVQKLPSKVDLKEEEETFFLRCLVVVAWEEVCKEDLRKESLFNTPLRSPLKKFIRVKLQRLLSTEIEFAPNVMVKEEWMGLTQLARDVKDAE